MAETIDISTSLPPPLARSRRLLHRRRTTVGLDVSGAVLKVAQVAWERETPMLVDFAAIPVLGGWPLTADHANVAGVLERLFASRGWERSRVVAGLSGSVAFFRHLKLPNLPAADLREAARWEGQNQLPYPPADVVVDYQPLGLDGDGKAEVLMAGAPRRAIEQVMDLARRAGITLSALEVDSLAIYRTLERNGLVEPGPATWTVVCDLGHEDTTLTAFRGGAPRLVRSFASPGSAAEGEMEHLTGVLVDEVRRSCEYLFYQDRSVTAASVFFSGDGAGISGLDRLVELRVNEGLGSAGLSGEVQVRVIDPVGNLALDPRLSPFRRQLGPNYACAVGLALRGEA